MQAADFSPMVCWNFQIVDEDVKKRAKQRFVLQLILPIKTEIVKLYSHDLMMKSFIWIGTLQ